MSLNKKESKDCVSARKKVCKILRMKKYAATMIFPTVTCYNRELDFPVASKIDCSIFQPFDYCRMLLSNSFLFQSMRLL